MTRAEVLVWPKQTLKEIPEQDNPCYAKGPENDGIIICLDEGKRTVFIVYEVKDQPAPNLNRYRKLGSFYNLDYARVFANAYAETMWE